MSVDTSGFTLRPWRRRFQLLGRRLGSLERKVFVWERPFTALPQDPDALVLPLLRANPHVGGAVIGSQPVAADSRLLALRGSIIRYAPKHFNRRLLRRTGTFSDFLHSMSSGTRQKLGQKSRKLFAVGGEDAFRLYQTPTEVTEFLRLAQDLAPRTYQARLLGAQLGTNAESIDRVMAWAEQGCVIAATVVLDGRAAAFWVFRLLEGGVLESVYTGYDTAFDKLSPGTVLVYVFLERCFFSDPRFTLLDWTEGDADYKRLFSNESVRCADLMYFRSTPPFLWLLTLDVAVNSVSATTRPIIARLERGGYASVIRRWVRRQPPKDL